MYNKRIVFKNLIDDKLNSYQLFHKVFDRIIFLIYFDRNRILYININFLKQYNLIL